MTPKVRAAPRVMAVRAWALVNRNGCITFASAIAQRAWMLCRYGTDHKVIRVTITPVERVARGRKK